MSNDSESKLTRRGLTKSIAAIGAASLAGCPGNSSGGDGGDGGDSGGDSGGGGGGELGERVPEITLRYFSGIWATQFMERTSPMAQSRWEDDLGLSVNIEGVETSAYVSDVFGGKFAYDVGWLTGHTRPSRLDPNYPVVTENRIDGAGSRNEADQSLNYGAYASCEFSMPAYEQEFAATEEERRELVNEALSVASSDYMWMNIAPSGIYGAINTDTVEPAGVGSMGISAQNVFSILQSLPKEGTRKVISDSTLHLRPRNPYMASGPYPRLVYEYSPLIAFTPEAEKQGYLAEDWEVSDEARSFTFTLRDATFQDGTQITAEDVKFSFEFVDDNHADMNGAPPVGHSSIEVVDDRTVTISFEQPSLSFLNRIVPLIAILKEDVWTEADGNTGQFEPPNGHASGPFAVTEFQSSQRMEMETHTGHPFAPDPDELSGITVVAFDEEASLINAMRAGEVDTANDISFNGYTQLGEEDNMFTDIGLDYLPHAMVPYYPTAPTKFKPFRQALGMVLNRQEMQSVGLPGLEIEPELHSRVLVERHPWAAPEEMLTKYTDDPTGDAEGARQVLSDAGWGWDDDGNLHYPPDADLEPRWAEGEAPSPENYPCLDEIL